MSARAEKAGAAEPVAPHGIVAIDPVAIFRAGLRALLADDLRLDLLANAGSPSEGLRALRRTRRRSGVVVLASLGFVGGEDSFWLIRRIREECPTLPILAAGSSVDWMTISRALFVGAAGFVDTNVEADEFLDAIVNCARGEVVLTGLESDAVGPITRGIDRQRENESILTERQRAVLTLAAEGLTARSIGERLGLQERTVTTHFENIYKRLGVHGRVAAISLASLSGFLTPSSSKYWPAPEAC